MYKLIPMFLFAFGFAETVEVYYQTDTPIAGFQFNVESVKVMDAFSGDAEKYGFDIFFDSNTTLTTPILGFSLTGSTIPAGNGILLILDFDEDANDACLKNVIISDSDGESLDTSVEDCNSIIISGTDGQIRGKITSLDGKPIIGTQVFIEELSIGAIADNEGNYILFNIPAGSYDISAEMILYRSYVISNVKVDTGKTTWLNFTLDCDACPKPSDGSINEFYNTSWAVIIGINEYENIKPLSYAVQDAKEIRDLLISNFGFPKENIKLLTDKEATLTNIKDDLYEIANMANEEDRILVYFAGHGETRSLKSGGDKGYLIPADGNIDKIFTTCLPMTVIKEIANITVAKHVLFLMDACFSGLATVNTRGLDRSTPGYIEKIARDQARQIITAGGKKDKVIEKDEWGHSAFAKNLIQGLKSAVADQDYDGYITADELGSFLQKRVTIDSEYQQTPLKARFGSGEGEFVFLARKIIESAIIGIIPNNIYERNEISSEEINEIHERLIAGISYLYADLGVGAKNILKDLTRLKKERDQAIQFIYGCMDASAINYNPNANLDDESCIVLDSDDVYIRFGDFHMSDSTLDVFMVSNRRIYNMEIIAKGFKIVDVINGNLNLDNIKTISIPDEILRSGWLGVAIEDIDNNLAKTLSLNSQRGVIISHIINDSPADNAGLEEKDVIILIDNEKVYDMLQFKHLMSKVYANDIKEFTIIRSGKEMNVTATLNELTVEEMIEPYDDKNLDYEQIFISYSDSSDGYIIPKEMTLLFKTKIMPIDEAFCFMGLTINEYDTINVQLGECKTGLIVQEVAITNSTEVELLSGEYATETGTILQETEEGKYDILLEDSTIVEGVDPSQVNRLQEQIYSGNYLYIKNVDYNLETIQIYFQTDTDIAGFQFNINGVSLISSYGGKAGESGFMLSNSKTTTIGFSLTGDIIPAGEGTLVELGFENYNVSTDNDADVAPFTCKTAVASFGCDFMWGGSTISALCPETCGTVGKSTICIENIVVSDATGTAQDTQAGRCWIP